MYGKPLLITFLVAVTFYSLNAKAQLDDHTISNLETFSTNENYNTIYIQQGGTLVVQPGIQVTCNNLYISKSTNGSDPTNAINLVASGSSTATLTVTNDIVFTANSNGVINLQKGTLSARNIHNLNGQVIATSGSVISLSGDITSYSGADIQLNASILNTKSISSWMGKIAATNTSAINISEGFNVSSTTSSITLTNSSLKLQKAGLDDVTNDFNLNGGSLTLNTSSIYVGNHFVIGSGVTVVDQNAAVSSSTVLSPITIKGNFDNNNNDLQNTTFSKIILSGGDQQITSPVDLKINNLELRNAASKLFEPNTYIANLLDISSSYMKTNQGIYLTKPVPTALVRTTGMIVLSEWHGEFVRYTSTIEDYLFPVGYEVSGQYFYRPMIIKPRTILEGIYASKAAPNTYSPAGYTIPENVDANLLQADSPNGSTPPYLCVLNENFFHKITFKTGTTPPADIKIFYLPGSTPCNGNSPTDFNMIAEWLEPNPTQKWRAAGAEGDFISGTIADGSRVVTLLAYTVPVNTQRALVLANGDPDRVAPPPYALLLKKPDAGFYLSTDNKIYFKFEEEYSVESQTALKYTIKDKTGASHSFSTAPIEQLGFNRFVVTIPSSVVVDNYHMLEVTNAKSEKWYLRFIKK